jgi:hypothetical protein
MIHPRLGTDTREVLDPAVDHELLERRAKLMVNGLAVVRSPVTRARL